MENETDVELQVFIDNVRWLMETHSLTEKQMASIMHIYPKTLKRLLAGEYSPLLGVNAIFYLSDYFGYKPPNLFFPLWK